jgi:predicted RNA-binding protein
MLLGGVLAIYVGFDDIQDKMREERVRQDAKLDKAREEMEIVRTRAEQYREELERLKEKAKSGKDA